MKSVTLRSLLLAGVVSMAMAAPALAGVRTALTVQVPPAGEPAQSRPETAPAPAPEAAAPAEADEGEDGEGVVPIITPVEEPEPAIPAIWSPVPRDEDGRSAYGLYVAGRLALTRGQGRTGASYLSEAATLTPEQPGVRDAAFTAALLTGDLDVAARLAPSADEATAIIVQAGLLTRAVQIYAHGDARAANAALAAAPILAPHARAGLLVSPWIAAAAGDWDRALAQPPADADSITALFVRQNRALLLENRRRYAEAEAEFKALTGFAVSGALFRLPYGVFLERRGRALEALALYDAAIAAGQADEGLRRARARVAAGGRAPAAPDLRQGAALALTAAAAQASAERAQEFAAVYLRLALSLDPTDETRLRLGQAMGRARLAAASRDVLGQVTTADPALYANARVQLGLSLEADGQSDAALAEFRRAVAALPSEPAIARVLAAQLSQQKRYDEALTLLNGPLLNTADQPFDVHFLRGAAYESTGRVAEAEAELWAALQKQPDNANALNYLGYLWVDNGTRVAEGAAMIERAHTAEPDNGNIQDSFGWAQYRQGRFEEAVSTLEKAVAREPANAEINDHLGDAYWQVGRRREAGYQWARVLSLNPDADQAARAQRKLAEGLESAGAQP